MDPIWYTRFSIQFIPERGRLIVSVSLSELGTLTRNSVTVTVKHKDLGAWGLELPYWILHSAS